MSKKVRHDPLAELEEHIAQCTQCQSSPYNPCAEGNILLDKVVEEAKDIRKARTLHFVEVESVAS